MAEEQVGTLEAYLGGKFGGKSTPWNAVEAHTRFAAECALNRDCDEADLSVNLAKDAEKRRADTKEEFKIIGLPAEVSGDDLAKAAREFYESQGYVYWGSLASIRKYRKGDEKIGVNIAMVSAGGCLVTVLGVDVL